MSKDEEKNEIHIGDWVVSLKVYPLNALLSSGAGFSNRTGIKVSFRKSDWTRKFRFRSIS